MGVMSPHHPLYGFPNTEDHTADNYSYGGSHEKGTCWSNACSPQVELGSKGGVRVQLPREGGELSEPFCCGGW